MTLWKAATARCGGSTDGGNFLAFGQEGNLSGSVTEGAPTGPRSGRWAFLLRGAAMADLQVADLAALRHTPLQGLHAELGARIVPFAGYAMPVQYPSGIIAEHLHTRAAAGLFDVSHMGQAIIEGDAVSQQLEALVPGDIEGLAPGQMRYTQLLNADGGILDDLMITRLSGRPGSYERFFVVVNASRKEADFALLRQHLAGQTFTPLDTRALVALQGPLAVSALVRHLAGVDAMAFMTMRVIESGNILLYVSRSGYTGEDGFEISLPSQGADRWVRSLLAEPEVRPIGLGARDSLRLEAGLCLYGHDIDESTTPVEAALVWSISKRRQAQGGFPGDKKIVQQIATGAPRRRVGLLVEGRVPAREGAEIAAASGARVGHVTSGGFGPTVNGPLAMGYVETAHSSLGTSVDLIVRGRRIPARISKLPFITTRYHRVK
jgi:aminomethyltransferase